MTAQPSDESAPPITAVPDPPVVRINSDPDAGGLKPFELAYIGPGGDEVVETLNLRLKPPFAIYRRWVELDTATSSKIPARMEEAARRFFRVGMPVADANRLIELIEGDADQVGSLTIDAIGDVIEMIRAIAYDPVPPVPQSPGSSTGQRSTGRSSSAKKSSRASKSTASRRTKR